MKFKFLIGLAILSFASLQAQITNDSILKDFDNFIKIPESNVFLHLNKSFLMQGEDLGFKAYVLDHKKQLPSQNVKNLYCQIVNSRGKVIKEKMMLVDNGRANGTFAIDSILSPGNYSVRSFTNWMKNFENPYYFEAPIVVINPATNVSTKSSQDVIKVHLLPEGGHLVKDVLTTVGLKIDKTESVENDIAYFIVNGEVADRIQLDQNGIGRFTMNPSLNTSYGISLNKADEVLSTEFPKIEDYGVVMDVNQVTDKVYVGLKTNSQTLHHLDLNDLSLLVNSNGAVNIYEVSIKGTDELVALDKKDLSPGVNQITLLSKDKQVISKRLVFNDMGFYLHEVKEFSMIKNLDSINTFLKFEKIKNANLSVTVHSTKSASLDRNQSIAAAFKLNPYLYGEVNNPLYYLNLSNKKKRFEMDNLMLSYGWEMYDWNFIFKKQKVFNYNFESGISVQANVNKSRTNNFLIYPGRNSGTTFVNLKEGASMFSFQNYFPTTKEKFKISEIDKKDKPNKTNLYLQFNPNIIPHFNSSREVKHLNISNEISDVELKPFSSSSEKLDTIVLKADIEEKRQSGIRNRSRGSVNFFSDNDRKNNVGILQYLRRYGLQASDINGQYSIVSLRLAKANGNVQPMSLVLDDVVYTDLNILQGFNMSSVDYIEIDQSGFTGKAGSGKYGIITIKTDPLLDPFSKKFKNISSYEVPLTFSSPEKFFTPSYYSYTYDFFDKLGVIDWQGDLEVIDGKTSFTMPYFGKDQLILHIQGWTESGELIDDYKIVEVNK
ncbi:hypothetical protein LY01_02507 [Nonlabens xylanidelens]|uniref:TonB-dependent receptor-like protein n=1 Tax=Nonlabens xylanidelens TaxID=191564 RepID=A0A2S6IHN3_9FLAO|nr:hypothetical protein [Nonlabens xylanidelens]PPK93723.1 hypothetical protein LY01_02507 [Nonlabens xylanidelens]